ncbi:MAG: hypothetical protein KDD25_00130 [Bdellovibrionales bacterium]|nr:hypothetical protein [Bdellovibrionales bacterium]
MKHLSVLLILLILVLPLSQVFSNSDWNEWQDCAINLRKVEAIVSPANSELMLRESPYETTKMVMGYDSYDVESMVPYFAPEVLAAHQVYSKDSKLYYRTGELVHVDDEFLRIQLLDMRSPGADRNDKEDVEYVGLIYIMDEEGRIYIENPNFSGPRSNIRHSSFFWGKPVAAAGTLIVRNGVIVRINDFSGHYKPKKKQFAQFLEQLSRMGLSVDFDELYSIHDPTSSREGAEKVLAGILPDLFEGP